jgi:hypothetical protein
MKEAIQTHMGVKIGNFWLSVGGDNMSTKVRLSFGTSVDKPETVYTMTPAQARFIASGLNHQATVAEKRETHTLSAPQQPDRKSDF